MQLPNQDSSSFVSWIAFVDSLKLAITIPVRDILTPIDKLPALIANVTSTYEWIMNQLKYVMLIDTYIIIFKTGQ